MKSSTPARFHKCSGCNVVYAVEDHSDAKGREMDSLPDECHVCDGEEFVPVYDRNGTGSGKSSEASEAYLSRSRHQR
jgi:hypothetical protein